MPNRRRRWLRAFGRNFVMLGVTGLVLNRMHQGNWDHAPPTAMTVVVLVLSLLFATMDEGGQVGVTWE